MNRGVPAYIGFEADPELCQALAGLVMGHFAEHSRANAASAVISLVSVATEMLADNVFGLSERADADRRLAVRDEALRIMVTKFNENAIGIG